ncbi:hypothetical protein Leryth_024255 [Lithospermum erythrorhizon]|nr:hypothetical protein Leryth_024255 [Lithospermum erythrorhizon]
MHLLVKAIVSQIEHGIVNLNESDHPQISVLMDCDGLSPFGFPVHMMRSCAMLLQDHYPNRLGCLAIIRLPQIARVVTQTLFQVFSFSPTIVMILHSYCSNENLNIKFSFPAFDKVQVFDSFPKCY